MILPDRTMIRVNFKLWVERSVSISYVILKKSIRKSDPKLRYSGIDFFARIATKIMSITLSASFVNKYTPITRTKKTIQNGLAVINVNDGYFLPYSESYWMREKIQAQEFLDSQRERHSIWMFSMFKEK